MINKTLFFFLSFGLFCLLGFPNPVDAETITKTPQQIFRVSPVILNVPLSPGKSYSYDITVENMTTNPLPLKASLNDFETTGEEGGYLFEESRTNPLLSWITLDNNTFILNTKEKKKIRLVIKTPQAIALGGYYGMLFFEPVLTNTQQSVTHVQSKVGVLLLANIGVPDPKEKKGEIVSFLTGYFPQNNTLPFLLRVKNVSLHFFTAKPILTISPLLPYSETIDEPFYLEEKVIFQNKIRRWTKEISINHLKPNIYKATLKVSTGNGDYVTQEKYFIIFPFIQFLSVGVVLFATLFVIRKRKRLKKTFKAFFAKD